LIVGDEEPRIVHGAKEIDTQANAPSQTGIVRIDKVLGHQPVRRGHPPTLASATQGGMVRRDMLANQGSTA
jgi:hypothetical protein